MELAIFNKIILGFSLFSILIFINLLFFRAPYGRFSSKAWGFTISHKVAWVMMEYPTVFLFLALYLIGNRKTEITPLVFSALWMFHYLHRTFIYPFMVKRSAPWSLTIAFFGMFFQIVNVYIQARWIFTLSPDDMYTPFWLLTPPFIVGVSLFFIGQIINKSSDRILQNLRSSNSSSLEYKIPYGGLFRFISCPNYFGETLIWLGWAIMLWAPAGFVFFLWTFANLFPRALAYHKWYLKKFEGEYPKNRKAFIPFII
jgi:3-oxo-5-alpha-steroid 4-dehydrogenase 1